MRTLVTMALTLLLAGSMAIAGTVKGIIKDGSTGDPLIGANVLLDGTIIGSTTDADGFFMLKDVPGGSYTLVVSYLGYAEYQTDIRVDGDVSVDISMDAVSLVGRAVEVITNRARERETPVAFTDVPKEQIQARLGSQDIPMVLNTTPSVYATMQGGGSGDARINVRGFDQRNFAIMINGVPVNDMENGWVYWSNWDGVGDATSSIQMQRGLSAVNLAVASIGGTMNILTDPTATKPGVMVKQEIGNDAFLKSTASFGTGLLGGKLAMNGTVVRKTGDGIIDGTWTDAWAYYFGASYNLNKNNRLEAYAIGAPQRHGQNLFRQNIAVYDAEFAKDLKDYDQEALTIYNQAGLKFNQNVAPVTNYNAQQAVEDKLVDRHDASFLNERENFYHKPQVNLNWYSKLTESLNLFSVAYYSGGYGGGTGTQGSLLRQNFFDDGGNPFGELPWSWDWDATIARNQANADGSRGILRNSRNNQYTYGLISKAEYKANDNVKYVVGVDWRTAEIEHYREVRDLLGGEYYRDFTQNDFWSDEDRKRGLGDRIAYDFTNTVDWVGGFGQVEYSKDKVSAYGMFGYSGIKYGHENFFLANEQDENGDPIVSSGPLTRETDWIAGYQAKGGANFRINEDMNVFFNVGYVSKVPIFDEVINDVDGTERGDFNNEHFTSYEMGWAFSDPEGLLAMNISGYYTQWSNRANRRNLTFREADGTELDVLVFLDGIDALHSGIEMEAALKPHKMLRFDGMVSWALWKHTSDAGGEFRLYGEDSDVLTTGTLNFALKDLRVGDAPQFQTALTMTVTPMRGLNLQATGRYYGRHYAGWNPFDRVYQPGTDDLVDRTQSWQAPNYGVLDLHGYYTLPIDVAGLKFRLFGHVFNALDGLYIQDATDNSAFNAWDRDHDADDAEVYFGLPRTFNFGLQINL